jgi:CO/xanthine dehydrogenase Mo-binding subunit
LDDWLSVRADGRVTLRTGKVELGQRISTAIAVIAAEELDVELERIDIVGAETGVSPDEGITSASNSMEQSGQAVRLAAATARHHLLARAASALEVDAASLEVADGLIRSTATNRSTTYWELFGDEAFAIPVDLDAEVKSPDEFRHIGRRVVARGMEDLVNGKLGFVHDLTMPGMLYARVVRPPHYHARLRKIDETVLRRLAEAGVRVVRDGSFVAVAVEDEYAAVKAAERVAGVTSWNTGGGIEPQDVFERLLVNDRVSLPVIEGVPRDEPVPALADPPPEATVTLRSRFESPYRMHGSIGPSAALALSEDDRLSVWTHSQGIYTLRASLAEALNMKVDAVRVVHVPGAGCYGHNGADDAALDAALVARAIPGRPVMLKWSREDEHAWEPYGSCMAMELCASLDAGGSVVAWSHETYSDTHSTRPYPGPNGVGPAQLLASRHLARPLAAPTSQPSMGRHRGIHHNLDPLYTFPGRRLVKHLVRDLPLRTSALRSLGAYANVFALESFIDELAEAAGADPVEFRLRHLADERAIAVVEAVAERMGWNETAPAPGHGRGIAFAQYKNIKAYVAVGMELEVTDAAEVRLHHAVIAADAGQVVDPVGLAAQLEGGLLQAASWTLYEEVRFDRDGITSCDWESYPILRFDNIPEIDTVLMDRPGEPFLGVGEAPPGPTAGAIANAIRDATGLRLYRLPFTPDAIRQAALK